ncbi:MAG: Flagellar hook-basal body complex protein FliE [Syntrophorhabdus sp. PtaB.Bin184]|jgi:flagellar hook-basal body complex protein FliE|nr:MAG: Flagellar hook-basal body complex protein FliE [Syntrophorhabdus sp. PtaB.Bin184]
MKVENFTLPSFGEVVRPANEKTRTSFGDVLKDSINKVVELEKEADKEVEKLARMENTDVQTTMIAIEKADLSFQMMMQIRNKIISAYEEIMRMQV